MDKVTNQKNEKWTSRNIASNILVYAINYLIFVLIFLLIAFCQLGSFSALGEFLSDATKILYFCITLLAIYTAIIIFYYSISKNYIKTSGNLEMVLLTIELSVIINFIIGFYVGQTLALTCLVALFSLFLINRRTAIFNHVIYCSIVITCNIFFLEKTSTVILISNFVINLASGILAVFVIKRENSRIKIILKSFFLSIFPLISSLLSCISTGFTDTQITNIIFAVVSGPLTIIVFMVVIPFFEFIFKKLTVFKLAELTDHKHHILRRLVNEASGTFNHVITVSTLAEFCAISIGEDPMLAKACAYYHDIGKIRRPEFFAENQADGVNPHDDIIPELSANIIKAHVKDGYDFLKKHHFPQIICDVCLQHHGTMPIVYFYNKAKKYTDGDVDIKEYCYAGPKPQTKIAAIIMIADGVEAAVRTLKDRSVENVKKAIYTIVNSRIELGQLNECDITFKEMNIIIDTMTNTITGIYHKRLSYPKVKIDAEKFNERNNEITNEGDKNE